MITELAPTDTDIQVGDQIQVANFRHWLDVTAVAPGGVITIRYNGIEQTVRASTVQRVRKDVR